jgi:hypothetical protein
VNQLHVLCRRVPAVKQERTCLEVFTVERVDEHLLKMVVLGLAIHVRGIHPIVNRIEVPVFAGTMHQVDHPDPFDHAMLIAAVLRPHQLNEARIPFVLHAIIHQQKGFVAIRDAVLHQFPHLPGQKAFLVQKIVDYVVAHLLQMLGQIGTRTVLRRTHQILDVLLLGNHTPKMLFLALKRKSWIGIASLRSVPLLIPSSLTKTGAMTLVSIMIACSWGFAAR